MIPPQLPAAAASLLPKLHPVRRVLSSLSQQHSIQLSRARRHPPPRRRAPPAPSSRPSQRSSGARRASARRSARRRPLLPRRNASLMRCSSGCERVASACAAGAGRATARGWLPRAWRVSVMYVFTSPVHEPAWYLWRTLHTHLSAPALRTTPVPAAHRAQPRGCRCPWRCPHIGCCRFALPLDDPIHASRAPHITPVAKFDGVVAPAPCPQPLRPAFRGSACGLDTR